MSCRVDAPPGPSACWPDAQELLTGITFSGDDCASPHELVASRGATTCASTPARHRSVASLILSLVALQKCDPEQEIIGIALPVGSVSVVIYVLDEPSQ
jgi:hypothetical protein